LIAQLRYELLRRKIFLIIIDNGPCHNLQDEGVDWLQANALRTELHQLPAYSPNTTHNRFFKTTDERDTALRKTFHRVDTTPAILAGQVARFL